MTIAVVAAAASGCSDRPEIRPALQKVAYEFERPSATLATARAANAAQGLSTELDARGGVQITGVGIRPGYPAWHTTLELASVGRGSDRRAAPAVSAGPKVSRSRATYHRGDAIQEWYENGPSGVEQGFVLSQSATPGRESQQGPLVLEVAVRGTVRPEPARPGVVALRTIEGPIAAHYSGLRVHDGEGRELPSWMGVEGSSILLSVEDRNAIYPITVDPVIWVQDDKMLPAGLGTVSDQLGSVVALSGDTAVIGASGSDEGGVDAGAAYVFVLQAGVWVQQQKLQADTPAPGAHFGYAVAVDGDVAIIGAHGDDEVATDAGAAYVFTRTAGVWTQQRKILPAGANANASFGIAAAMAGGVAVVGAYGSDDNGSMSGAAYILGKDQGGANNWGEVAKLTPADGAAQDNFGIAVALSGNTALIGARGDDDNGSMSGSAYVFVQSGGTWTQQTKLTASDGVAIDYFGDSVSLSGDSAVIGAHLANSSLAADAGTVADSGAAYVFVRSGSTWSEQQKLVAGDADVQDSFGSSVAISGDRILVGAQGDDEKAADAGASYLFLRTGTTWTQQLKLLASDAGGSDGFGAAVTLAGTTAVISSPADDDSGTNAGAAYVFAKDQGGVDLWGESGKLRALDAMAAEYCGYAVSVSGDTTLAGAYGVNDLGAESGAAYVFTRSGMAWAEQARLVAAEAAAGDRFGYAVSLDADTALVGAYLHDGAAVDSGAAFVFTRTANAWTEQAMLAPADGAASDAFGNAVAVDGDTALVGAFNDDDKGSNSGSVYVFFRTAGVWAQQAKLTAADGVANDTFGRSVALDGNVAIVGAPNDDDTATNSGSAYVFVRTGTSWAQQGKLTAGDAEASANFGLAVSVSATTALVGAYLDDTTVADTGSAYVFLRTGASWAQQAKLIADDAEGTDRFGISVALSGDTAVVGAQNDDDKAANAGAAYVYARTGTTWTKQAKLTAADGAANDYFGYAVAFDGNTAVAGAYGDDDKGSASGSAYGFELRKTDGTACTGDAECNSGHCTDNVCCTISACPDCHSCAIPGSLGQCAPNPTAVGNVCGDQEATDCSDADTCDATGVCQPRHLAAAVPCGDSTSDECTAADTCDGLGTCLPNDATAGTACNDTSSTECTQPDTCNGEGACLDNHEPDGTECPAGQCTAGACVEEPVDSGTGGAGGSAGAGGSGAAAGSGGSGGQEPSDGGGAAGAAPAAPAEPADDGCGCRTAGAAPAGTTLVPVLGLLAAMLLARRRERRVTPVRERTANPVFSLGHMSLSLIAAGAMTAGCGSPSESVTPPSQSDAGGQGGNDGGEDVSADTASEAEQDQGTPCPAAQKCGFGCCQDGQECVNSECKPACPAPRQRCGAELDVCCGADEDCVEGACVAACPTPRVRCGDEQTCCDTGQVCVISSCATPGANCTDYADCEEEEYCEPTLKVCLPTSSLPDCQYHPPIGDFAPFKEWTYGPTTAPYARETVAQPAVDICDGPGVPLAFPDSDESLVVVSLGSLAIPFFDANRSSLTVSTNGWLTFEPSYAGGPEPANTSFPHGSTPDLVVAPYWDDLRNVTACANIDTAGQKVVIQWHGQLAASGEWITVQATMNAAGHAKPGLIELAYLQLGATQDGDAATVGIAEPSKHRAVLLGFNQNGAVAEGKLLRFKYVPLHNRFDALTAPAVFDLDGDGHPEVIFPAYDDDPVAYSTMPNDPISGLHSGVLTILNGEDGTIQARPFEIAAYDGYLGGGVALSVGDINDDGKLEIVGLGRLDPMVESNPYIKAFSADGSLLWVSNEPVNINHNGWAGGVHLADLDGDGHTELFFGLNVYNSEGILQWAQPTENGSTLTTAADLDGDGLLEVVSDHSAWHHDGTNLWTRPDLAAYHFPSVADFDQDGDPEVALVSDGKVIVLHGKDGTDFWGPVSLQTNGGGPLNIGDFDGDGHPEIGTAGEGLYIVLDLQCTGSPLPSGCDREGVRWGAVTKDISSNVTGSSLFDFEGDGKAEVVYSDECFTRVYSGLDGLVLFETPVNTRTAAEYPLVADVDGDNNAEIIVVANESVTSCHLAPWNAGLLGTPWVEADYPPPYCGAGVCGYRGLSVYGDALDNWVRTRPVWSGHAYHITNVLADGRIPAHEEANWLHAGYNNFRMNAQGNAAFSAPDLRVALEVGTQLCPSKMRLAATVSNVGALGVAPGVNVAFYEQGTSGWECLGVVATVDDLLPGGSTEVTLDYEVLPGEIGKTLTFKAVADSDCDGKGSHNECENGGEDDNEGEATGLCQTQVPK